MRNRGQLRRGLGRRQFLAGVAGASVFAVRPAFAGVLPASDFGAIANIDGDQTEALQSAIDVAAGSGQQLLLDAGTYRVGTLNLPSGLRLTGTAGASRLVALTDAPALTSSDTTGLFIEGITVDGDRRGDAEDAHTGLVSLVNCTEVTITDCRIGNTMGNGLHAYGCSGRIANCRMNGANLTALFANDSRGLMITGNTISDCGNGAIRVFRSEPGHDGTIVTENRISNIRSSWGNGQNGNGINIYRANGVIVSDNVISNVDFSAVRLNSTEDSLVKGNSCRECREVAIFSEFAFSGSIIAENIIDGAAAGISITNFNDGGRLAVCMGNIVRNILPASPTNPDTSAIGIFAEADVAITSNVVENVPGAGIGAGWGEYLRNVLIANNLVRETRFGIGVSVAPGAGQVRISNNLIADAREKAIAAFAWTEQRGTDLAVDTDQFDHVTVEGNTVS